MGLRFYRRVRLCPGLRLNLSRSGVSASFGRRGSWITLGPGGTRATVGLPGTGLFYTAISHGRRLAAHDGHSSRNAVAWLFWLGLIYVVIRAATG